MFALVLQRRTPQMGERQFDPDSVRIRCPRCAWQPRREDRWRCDPGCLSEWNTFATAGVCPGCAKTWEETACLRCHAWSPHRDWYVHEDP